MDFSTPKNAQPMISGSFSVPSSPTPTTNTPSPSSRKHRWILWVTLAVILLALGGGYFAYSRGYISIPFLSPKSDELFSRLIDSLSKIDNAQYTVKVNLKAEPRKAGATSIFPSVEDKKIEQQDDQRRTDLGQIRSGLALYFDDNEKYPETLSSLSPDYIVKVPTDPIDKSAYPYLACDGGKHFVLYTGLELGEYYWLKETGNTETTKEKPTCNSLTKVNSSFIPWLIPTAYAQATPFSIESIGSEIELGTSPSSNLPLANLFEVFGLGDMESIIDIFPNDIDTSGAITFYTEADKKLKDADALLQMNATYHGGDLTADFDVEGRKIGTTVYGIVRKFPGIPYISQYISPIKDKWVKITPDDGNPLLSQEAWQNTTIKDAVEKTKQSLKLVLEGQAFTADKKMGTDTISGVQSAHYQLAIHADKIKPIFEKIIADRKNNKQDTYELELLVKELDRPSVQSSLQRFIDNSTVDIWIDKSQGLLRQVSWNLVVVPPEGSKKLEGKALTIGLTLTLDKVNKKVAVNKPGNTIDYNEAERLVTGITVGEQQFNHQRSRINSIRSALRGIKEASGSYPDSLNNLRDTWNQAIKNCEERNKSANRNVLNRQTTYCGYIYDDGSISTIDVYTNKPFGYVKEGDDYKVTYQMKLDFPIGESGYSSASYYKEDYVEGENIANKTDISIEKETPSEKYEKERAANTNRSLQNTNSSTNTNSSIGYMALTVVPPSVSFDAAPGTTLTSKIKVYNSGTKSGTVTTEVLNAEKGSDGKTPIFSTATDRTKFAAWTTLSPTSFTLEPGAFKEVSVTMFVPAGTTPQAYLGGIMFVQTASTGLPSKVGTLVQLTVVSSSATTTDTDKDGVADTVEQTYGSNPNLTDTDGDGLNDYVEIYTCQTSPTKKDTDGDTYEDKTEILNGYNPSGPGQATNTYCKNYLLGY